MGNFKVGDKVVVALHRNCKPMEVTKVTTTGFVVIKGKNNRLMRLRPYQLHPA